MASSLLRRGRVCLSLSKRLFRSHCNCHSSIASLATEKYREGKNVHGYTIQKVTSVPELSLTAILLSHDKTNAQHLHVARDDSNNVFGVAFVTTPMDDTGVPHILEHTALCGSDKFPVRDPFFKMLTRSLNTFMNAFTSSDWTMYPFSTRNAQDYRNLMSVYLDAAFFPRLTELDFMQEGWRLEHENPQDANSPIVFKGVVYNEMKGVFSTSQNLFSQRCQNLLLPSHTYSTVYGGEPAAIPDLTWEQLRDFHATHYHPSNARFYTYGNLPLEDHLKFISSQALNRFSTIDPNTEVPTEPRWQHPKEETMTCMPDPMAPDPNKQSTIAVSYLLGDITDTFESFTLSMLGSLLVQTENSPFYQSLLEANIGSDFSPVLGYDGNTRDTSFSVGLQGIHREDVDKVKAIIEDTFDKVVRDGFDKDSIEALLHKIELGQKHQTDKFGLYMGVSVLPCWIHGGDPNSLLQVNNMVTKFRQSLADNPQYLQQKVNQYFKCNPHKLTLIMHPDENFEAKRQKEEDARLQQQVAALSEDDKRIIYDKGLALLSEQMKDPDLSCLPSLQVSDIPTKGEQAALENSQTNGVRIQLSQQPTNDVTYFRLLSDLSGLEEDLLPYVPLFCTIVTRMGAGDWDYRQLSMEVDLKTGGLDASPTIISNHSDLSFVEKGVMFSSHCLNKNVDSMLDIWQQIFKRFDQSDTSRLTTLIMMVASDLANSVAGSGHRYAITHAASTLNPAAKLNETIGGMSQVSLMKSIAESSDWSEITYKLSRIATHVLSNSSARCSVNTTSEFVDNAHQSVDRFITEVVSQTDGQSAKENFFTKVSDFQAQSLLSHFELPFQVNYVSKCLPTVPYMHEDFACLRILANMLSMKYLHREIREKGGAYGGGAIGSTPGQFSFFSYRDPNSERTLDSFEAAVQWAAEGKFTQQDIDESKLAVFAQVDAPIPPGSQGLREFLHHIPYDVYQTHRQQLFAVTEDNLINAVQKYLTGKSNEASVSLLGPRNTLSKDNSAWNVIRQS